MMGDDDCIMIEDGDELASNNDDNNIQHILSTWKMFNDTIKPLIINIENSEGLLESLMSSIENSAQDFCNIFIAPIDSKLSKQSYDLLQKKFNCFSTWLLGHLFYILGCSTIQRLHEKSVSAQLRIINILYIKQPSTFVNLTLDYFKCLIQLVNSTTDNTFCTQKIAYFTPKENLSSSYGLDLNQVTFEVKTEEESFDLQLHILSILSTVLPHQLQFNWKNELTGSIYEYFDKIIINYDIKLKLAVLTIYTNLMKACGLKEFKNNIGIPRFFNILQSLDEIIARCSDLHNNIICLDIININNTIKEFIETLFIFEELEENIRNILMKVCNRILTSEQNEIKDDLKLSTCELCSKLLKLYPNPSFQESLQTDKSYQTCPYMMIFTKYTIINELKSEAYKITTNDNTNSLNVLNLSPTWSSLHFDLFNNLQSTSNIESNLRNINVILDSAVWLQIEFSLWHQSIHIKNELCFCGVSYPDFVHNYQQIDLLFSKDNYDSLTNKFVSLLEKYGSIEGCTIFELIIKISRNILILGDKKYLNINSIHNLIGIISSYHIFLQPDIQLNCQNFIKTLFHSEILDKYHVTIQMFVLEALSFVNTVTDKNINDLYLKIFRFCINSQLKDIKNKAIQCLPYIYQNQTISKSTALELFTNIICQKKNEISIIIGKVLHKTLCINSGNNITILVNKSESCISRRTICLKCDGLDDCLREIQMGKICKTDKFNDVAAFNNIYKKSLKYFNEEAALIRKGLIELLQPLFVHTDICFENCNLPVWLNYFDCKDPETRKLFCSVFKKLIIVLLNNDILTKELKQQIITKVVQKLLMNVKASLLTKKSDFPLQVTTLYLIRELGVSDCQNLLPPCIKLLIYFLMSPQTPYGGLAMLYLSEISKYYNLTANFVFHKYKKEFCKMIVDLVIFYYCNKYNFGDIIFKISRAFGFKGHRDFISKEIHHILPYLIPCFVKAPESESLLTEIARLLQKEPSALLTELFFKIYPSIYLNESPEMTKNVMKFITKITGCAERDLKRRDFRMMIGELLIHYHSHTNAVISACLNLASIDPDFLKDSNRESAKSESALVQVADFLQPRFLGVVGAFGSQLVNNQIADSIKREVIESLADLIRLMGDKYITPLRFKVMSTLRSALALNVKEYGLLNINAWNAFIHTVNVQSLGSLLSTIFVSLLPLLEDFPSEINGMFKFLVINHETLLSSFIPDLFFLSKTNVDNNVKAIVQSHMSRVKSDCLIDNLKLLLKQVNHENMEVRQHALQHVVSLLSENKQELNDAILNSDIMHPVIVELIDALVTGTRESESLKLDYAKCLGELGAIEPSHLPRRYEENVSVFTFSATEDSFAASALVELTRALQFEKHTKYMDCFAVAIQEILKFFKISPTEKSDIWESFPVNTQEIMLLFLSSRYIVQPSTQPTRVHPLFGSSSAGTFSKWAFSWISALIPQISNKEVCALFACCKPSLNRDLRTLILFLPYIVLHALFRGNMEINNDIYEEMLTIINIKPHSYKTVKNTKEKNKSLPTIILDPIPTTKITEEDMHIKCTKMVYVLIDFLERWIREWVQEHCPKISNPLENDDFKAIHSFVNRFDKSVLSQGNFECEEYPRALLYLEWYLENNEDKINYHLSNLANIYAKLDEGDAVAGILSMMQREPSLQDQILFHEVTGQLQDAAACYERKAQEGSLTPQLINGMIKCYLGLDQPFMAYQLAHSLLDTETELACEISESLAEPMWRLGMFDELSELLEKETVNESLDWGVRIGQALIYFRNGQRNEFKSELDMIRTSLMNNLTTVSMEHGAYQQGYPHIIKLHILNEFENVEHLVYKIQKSEGIDEISKAVYNLLNEWQIRLNILQSSETIIEPVLCARRIILEQAKVLLGNHESNIGSIFDEHIAKSWINSVRLARKAGFYQQAYTYVLNAEIYQPKELFVEKAKLLWQKGEQSSAIRVLVRGVDEHFPNFDMFKTASSGDILPDRKLCAEAKLLIAIYNDNSVNVGTEETLGNYKTAVEVFKQWEKSLVFLAQYYDKIYSMLSGEEKENQFTESPRLTIHFYGNSLFFGCHYIYQSMPRMLSIWLDYGSTPTSDKDTQKTLSRITAMISNFAERLPCFMFFTAFSQLVSRICHPQPTVYAQLKEILIKIILKYPQQSLWMILCVYKSSYAQRYKRCAEVLQDPRLNHSDMAKLIQDFNILAEKLIDLTNKPIPDGLQETTVSQINRHLHKTFLDPQFSQIMMPVQEFRKIMIPSQDFFNSRKNRNEFNAFPNKLVYITGIKDKVIILASLQKPRRITFKGSDGKEYSLLLKPKDDLRKDFRLMEFNTIVNQYLHKDPDARQRRLKIRTYSVLPLNEECGIIEWVSNVIPLRLALLNIYKKKQMYTSAHKLKSMWMPKENLETKRKVFLSFYIKNHPPVFPEWFRFNFPDPHGWYQAKCAYIRTTAVISMVGYILGLGDRHGENILFDSTNGDTMHVDFNCLFNKGLAFEFPERVPFRMTHNMEKAMGPTGVEGMFRKSCEITMQILRAQRETLMSVLRPFVYDPLLSWSARSNVSRSSTATERTDKDSMRSVENIEKRLKGIMRGKSDQLASTLSLEGQVNYLIMEATSIDNLCQMYIGWGPYL